LIRTGETCLDTSSSVDRNCRSSSSLRITASGARDGLSATMLPAGIKVISPAPTWTDLGQGIGFRDALPDARGGVANDAQAMLATAAVKN
jgi:hypothetical protein